MRRSLRARAFPIVRKDDRRSESGDTLVEVLFAIVILGIAGVALLTAFGTSIKASAEHRQLANEDASLRAATDDVIAQIQDSANNAFSACPTPYSPTFTNLTGSFSVPTGGATVQYWNGSGWAPNCTVSTNPQLWSVTLTSASYTTSVSTVIYDPQPLSPTGGTTPAKLVFLQPTTTGTGTINAAVSPQPIVAVEDASNNIVYSDASSVALAASGPGALSNNCSGIENNGIFSFSNCSMNAVGTYTLTATDSVCGACSATASYTISTAPPAKIAFTTTAVSGTASTSATLGKITVQAQDAFGNADPGGALTVNLGSSSAAGIFATSSGGTPITSVTIPSGQSTASFWYGDTAAGSPIITASSSGLQSGLQTEGISPAAENKLVLTTAPPSTFAAGTAFGVGVTVEDQFGNTITTGNTGSTDTIKLTLTGGTFFPSGTTVSAAASNGVATFNNLQIRTPGSYTITATDTTHSAVTAAATSFTVTPAPPSQLVFTSTVSGNHSVGTSASVGPFQVTVEDQFGNAVTNTGSPVSLGLTSSSAGSTFFTPTSGGTSSATVTIPTGSSTSSTFFYADTKAGSPTITATATVNTFVVSGTSSGFTMIPAAENKLAITTQPPSSVAAGQGFSVGVTVEDQFGNQITTGNTGSNDSIQIALVGGSFASGTTTVTAGNGLANFTNLKINAAGTYSITASDTTHATVTPATTNPFNVVASTPTKLVFTSTVSGSQTVTSSANVGPFQVQAQDAFNNPVTNTNAAATVTLSSSSTGTTFFTTTSGGSSASAVTIANASSSSPTFFYADTKAGSPTITASVTINGTLVSGTTNGFTMTAGSAATVAFVQQPGTTTAGNAISPAPTVQVEDTFGNAVADSGATVTMSVNSGPGAFTGGSTTSTTTSAGGLATFSNLVINTSGSYTIQAASSGLGTVNSNAFTIKAKTTVASLAISAIGSPQTAGSGFAVTVTGFDSFGNVVNNSTDSVQLGIAAGSPQNTFSNTGTATMTATLNAGVATFNGVTFNTAGTTYVLTAKDTTVSVSAPNSNTFTVQAAGASKLAFVQQPTTTTAGNAISPAPTVQVEDTFGNAVADNGATVTMSVNSGPGGFTGSTTSTTTNAGGLATFSNLVLNTSGSYTIKATSSGLGNVNSNSFTVNPATAVKVAFVQQPTATTAGSAISPSPTVQVEDTFGNAVPGSGVAVTMSPNGFSLTGGSTTSANTNAGGLATFSNLVTNTAGSGYTLTAASSGLGTVNSNTFTVNAGTPTKLVFTSTVSGSHPVTSSANVGPFQVQAQDNFNNPVTNINAAATVTLSSSSTGTHFFTTTSGGSSASAVTIANNASSSPTFFYADTQSGTPTITASATINGTLVSGTTNGFTMTAGSASKVAFVQQPTTTTAGSAISPAPTVQVEDTFGNAVADSGATVTMTANGFSFTAGSTTSATTNAGGLATFSNLVTNTAGSGYTLTAASSGLGNVTSNSFTVNPATANKVVFVQQPTTTTAGNAINPAPTVQVEDTFGNAVPGSGVTVTMTANGFSFTGGSTTSANTNAAGLATFSNLVTNTAGSGYTLTAASSGLGTVNSNAFTVNPAAASKIVFVQQPTTTTAGNAISPAPTVQVEDTFGNAVADNGATVTMSVNSGPGGFTGSTTSTTTNAGGLATFSNLVLNTSGSYTIKATSSGLGNVNSNSFTVNPATAVKVAFVQQPTATTAGSAISPSPTVQVEDTFGNAVPGSGVAVTMSPNGFSLTGGSTTSANTNAGGLATFSNLVTNTAGSGYTLTAASSGLGTVNSNTFTVNAGTPTKLVFTSTVSGSHPVTSSANVGPFQVQAQDNFNNPVTNINAAATVTLSSSSTGTHFFTTTSGGSSASAVTIANNASSSPTFFYADTQSGTPTITASVTINGTLVSGTTNGFTMTPGGANKVGFVQQPTTTTAGSAISPAPTVQVEDTFGNAVADSGATVTMTANGFSFTAGSTTSATTNAGGLATFSNLVTHTAGSGYTLTAASSGLGTVNSSSFTVSPNAPNKLAFNPEPPATGQGDTTLTSFGVSVEDTYGNVETSGNAGSTDTITLSLATKPTGGAFSSASNTYTNVAAVNGTATFSSVALNNTAGSYTFTATDTQSGDTGVTTATSTPATVITHATIALVSTSSATVKGSTSLTITAPSNLTAGDVLLAQVTARANLVTAGNVTSITAPSGWTQVSGATYDGNHTIFQFAYTCVVGSSGCPTSSSSWTWSWPCTNSACAGGSAADGSGGIFQFSGVNTTTPVDVAASNEGAGTPATALAVTTTLANDEIVAFFGSGGTANFSGHAPTGNNAPSTPNYAVTSSNTASCNGTSGACSSAAAGVATTSVQAAAGSSGTYTLAGTNATYAWVRAHYRPRRIELSASFRCQEELLACRTAFLPNAAPPKALRPRRFDE